MNVACPNCQCQIPANRLNVETDVAVCDKCNGAYCLSKIVNRERIPDKGKRRRRVFKIGEAPSGTWFEDLGTGWRIGATTRSWFAFFLVPFMCVWSGFSLGGIYGTQILKGQFNLALSLFGLPFLAGTLLFGSIAVMTVCGKVVVTSNFNEGCVFEGVGPFGWRRRFKWSDIDCVKEEGMSYNYSGSSGRAIALIGQSQIKFGSMLSEPRRYYMLRSLQKLQAQRMSE